MHNLLGGCMLQKVGKFTEAFAHGMPEIVIRELLIIVDCAAGQQ